MASKSRRRRRAAPDRPAGPDRRQEAALRREAGSDVAPLARGGGRSMNTILAKPGAISRETVEQIVREIVLARRGASPASTNGAAPAKQKSGDPSELIVNISARHVHLTDEHVEVLFGAGHKLTPMRDLYQQGAYAADETVMVIGPRRRMLPNVRVLGPTR